MRAGERTKDGCGPKGTPKVMVLNRKEHNNVVLCFSPATARCFGEGGEKAGSWIYPGTGLSQMTTAKGEREKGAEGMCEAYMMGHGS